MLLTELMDTVRPYIVQKKRKNDFEAIFTTRDDVKYIVGIHPLLDKHDLNLYFDNVSKTQSKFASEVIGTVFQILFDYVRKVKPDYIRIRGMEKKGSIYGKVLRTAKEQSRYASIGYEIVPEQEDVEKFREWEPTGTSVHTVVIRKKGYAAQ